MNVADFDKWRAGYSRLSYRDQVKFYDRVEHDHPAQNSYRLNWAGWLRFFEYVTDRCQAPRILEIGGWHGEMAAALIEQYQAIASWDNYEISRAAVSKPACGDKRYHATVPGDYAWNVRLPEADVLVGCHVFEHVKRGEFRRLLDNLPAAVLFAGIEMPLPERGPVYWAGYHGSHIFEAGWGEAELDLAQRGFKRILLCNELRGFER